MRHLISCALLFTAAAWAGAAGGKEPLKAQFYADLGPDKIDVSKYPKQQQEDYAVFRKSCSQCHTLARAVNSPWVTELEWQRYVLRMHKRTEAQPGTVITEEAEKAIVDFLVFDAKARKVTGKKKFDALTAKLKARFEKLKAGRAKQQKRGEAGKAEKAAP